jgi:hypothetical protein
MMMIGSQSALLDDNFVTEIESKTSDMSTISTPLTSIDLFYTFICCIPDSVGKTYKPCVVGGNRILNAYYDNEPNPYTPNYLSVSTSEKNIYIQYYNSPGSNIMVWACYDDDLNQVYYESYALPTIGPLILDLSGELGIVDLISQKGVLSVNSQSSSNVYQAQNPQMISTTTYVGTPIVKYSQQVIKSSLLESFYNNRNESLTYQKTITIIYSTATQITKNTEQTNSQSLTNMISNSLSSSQMITNSFSNQYKASVSDTLVTDANVDLLFLSASATNTLTVGASGQWDMSGTTTNTNSNTQTQTNSMTQEQSLTQLNSQSYSNTTTNSIQELYSTTINGFSTLTISQGTLITAISIDYSPNPINITSCFRLYDLCKTVSITNNITITSVQNIPVLVFGYN